MTKIIYIYLCSVISLSDKTVCCRYSRRHEKPIIVYFWFYKNNLNDSKDFIFMLKIQNKCNFQNDIYSKTVN